jgi:eukaryotic-like serine/threonine-protein kinase
MLSNHDALAASAARSGILDGRYQVERTLHETREGTLLLAVESRLRRRVAIKVVEVGARSDAAARFSAVVQFLSRLEHPNCVHVIDTGTTPKGLPYAVMPFTEGTRLRDLIDRGALEPRRAATLAIAILRGLAHAHRHGGVHRDLKPDCVIVPPDSDGDARISDFWSASVPGWNERQVGMTLADLDVGTAEYSSPEQALGMEIDERSDLYAVGIILFEMLHGAPPFSGEDPFHVLQLQIHSPLPPLREDVPVALARVVHKLTDKEPSERYGTANDALIDLETFVATIDSAYADLTGSLGSAGTGRVSSHSTNPMRSSSAAAITAAELGRDDADPLLARRGSSRTGLWFVLGVAAFGLVAGGYAISHRANTASAAGAVPANRVAPAATGSAEPAAVEPQRPVLGKTLSSLAIVNEPRIERAAPYRGRRALVAELEAEGHGEKIDQRLQVAMDLAQAADSPTPCRTFAAALTAIEGARGDDFTAALAGARVPDDAPGAGQAPDERCDGLAARLARARGEGDVLASAEPVRVANATPHRADKRRTKKPGRATQDRDPPAATPAPAPKPAAAAAPSPIAKVKDPPPIRKLDDGIKRL